MSGHLCLKWNNHSSAFLKSIINIHSKEKYCDATIVCQGKYFPVHRVVLSTCSDYFDEMFERMQCPNPYIVFRDIEPKEMELLLNYMYQGEVNVIQESLPTLIKAAEALKIKGLAVPDDLPSSKEPSGRKRSSTSNDTPLSKRRAEERRKRRDSPHRNSESDSYSQISSDRNNLLSDPPPLESIQKIIKEEPLDTSDYVDSNVPNSSHSSVDSHSINKEENLGTFEEFPVTHIKTEDGSLQGEDGLYEGQQSSAWSEYPTSNIDDLPPPDDLGGQDDIFEMTRRELSSSSKQRKQKSNSSYERNTAVYNTVLHPCPMCDYKSKDKNRIKTHLRFTHAGERPFPCHLCPAAFTSNKDLKNHLRIHTGEKPHECPKCLTKFRLKDHLKKHLNKKVQCEQAEPNFAVL